jgi:hypothetical protein
VSVRGKPQGGPFLHQFADRVQRRELRV